MKYEITENSVAVFVDNPDRAAPHRVCLSPMRSMTNQEIEKLLKPSCRWLAVYKYQSRMAFLRAIKRFSRFMEERSSDSLPDSDEEWQRLVVECYAWQLGGKSGGTLASRQKQWRDAFLLWFRMLQAEGVIPARLVFPKARFKRQVARRGSTLAPRNLGEQPPTAKKLPRKSRNKTLAGDLWASNDVDYLRSVEAILNHRIHVLRNVVDDYWCRLVCDYRKGRNLMRSIPRIELLSRIHSEDWRSSIRSTNKARPYLVTNARVPGSEAWTLCLMRYVLDESSSLSCLQAPSLIGYPGYRGLFRYGTEFVPRNALLAESAMPERQKRAYPFLMLCMRFLGVLNPIDIAVACVILIQEHPNLNPRSLITALILDEHGKSMLVDPGPAGELVFSVDKPRANCRKYVTLTPRAARVLRHVIRVSEPVRQLLRRAKSPLWRHLFVGNAGRSLGRPDVESKHLTSSNLPSLARFYPELQKAGLELGTLDFAKVRVTHGILEWFKTGSVRTVSRKLGNSVRVALEHYIPEELIHLWNERILRRFQNTLIVMSAGTRQRMLAISDLKNKAELELFLAAIAVDFPREGTPIGPYLHGILLPHDGEAEAEGEGVIESPSKSVLSTRIDSYALALLYAHCELFDESRPSPGPLPDQPTECSNFNDVLALGRFLRLVASREEIGDSLSEVLQVRKLRIMHERALPLVPNLRSLLSSTEHGGRV